MFLPDRTLVVVSRGGDLVVTSSGPMIHVSTPSFVPMYCNLNISDAHPRLILFCAAGKVPGVAWSEWVCIVASYSSDPGCLLPLRGGFITVPLPAPPVCGILSIISRLCSLGQTLSANTHTWMLISVRDLNTFILFILSLGLNLVCVFSLNLSAVIQVVPCVATFHLNCRSRCSHHCVSPSRLGSCHFLRNTLMNTWSPGTTGLSTSCSRSKSLAFSCR